MHARQKYSSYGNIGGPREVIKAGREVVESQMAGAFASQTFLSLDRLHLREIPKKCSFNLDFVHKGGGGGGVPKQSKSFGTLFVHKQ